MFGIYFAQSHITHEIIKCSLIERGRWWLCLLGHFHLIVRGEGNITFPKLIHVFSCKRGTWNWDFWWSATGHLADGMFVHLIKCLFFWVKCNCFHHAKVTIIYAICQLPPYHGYPKLERAWWATSTLHKLDLAASASHVGCLISYFYDFSTLSVILHHSLARVNSPKQNKIYQGCLNILFFLTSFTVYTATFIHTSVAK